MSCAMNSFPARVTLLLVLATGCSLTKGYEGPPRPPEEIARIYFYSDKNLSSDRLEVDGVEKGYLDIGIEVLPGERAVGATVSQVEEECFYEVCSEATTRHRCDGTIRVEGGKSYEVRFQAIGQWVGMSFSEGSTNSGAGRCVDIGRTFSVRRKPENRNRQ